MAFLNDSLLSAKDIITSIRFLNSGKLEGWEKVPPLCAFVLKGPEYRSCGLPEGELTGESTSSLSFSKDFIKFDEKAWKT